MREFSSFGDFQKSIIERIKAYVSTEKRYTVTLKENGRISMLQAMVENGYSLELVYGMVSEKRG